MRQVLADTYRKREENSPLKEQLLQLQEETGKLERLARIGMAAAGQTWSDTAPTRYSETETRDVLLVRKWPHLDSRTLVFTDGSKLELPKLTQLSTIVQKRIAREIHERLVSVPVASMPEPPSLQDLGWLRPYIYVGRDRPALSVGVVRPGGEIRSIGDSDASSTHRLYYLDGLGFVSHKRQRGETYGS